MPTENSNNTHHEEIDSSNDPIDKKDLVSSPNRIGRRGLFTTVASLFNSGDKDDPQVIQPDTIEVVDEEGLNQPIMYSRKQFLKIVATAATSLALSAALPASRTEEQKKDKNEVEKMIDNLHSLGIDLNGQNPLDTFHYSSQSDLFDLLGLSDSSLSHKDEMDPKVINGLYQNVFGPLPFISPDSNTGLFIANDKKWKPEIVSNAQFGKSLVRTSVHDQYFSTISGDSRLNNPVYSITQNQNDNLIHLLLKNYGYDRIVSISDEIFEIKESHSRAKFEQYLRKQLVSQYLSNSIDQNLVNGEFLNPQFQGIIKSMGGSFTLQRTTTKFYSSVCESIMTGNPVTLDGSSDLKEEDLNIMIEFIEKHVLFGNSYSFDKTTATFNSIDQIVRPKLNREDFANNSDVEEELYQEKLRIFNERMLKGYNVVVNDPRIIEQYRRQRNMYMDSVSLTDADFAHIESIFSKFKDANLISSKKILFFLGYFNNNVADVQGHCHPVKVPNADGYITIPYDRFESGSQNNQDERAWCQGACTHEYGHALSITNYRLDPLFAENGIILGEIMPITELQLHEIFDLIFENGKWIQESSKPWSYAGLNWFEFWASMIETYTQGRLWFEFIYGPYFDNYDNRIRKNNSLPPTVDRLYREMKEHIFLGKEFIKGNDKYNFHPKVSGSEN